MSLLPHAGGVGASVAAALAVLAIYAGLIVSLLWFFDTGILRETLFSERTLFSVRLSLMAATLATLLALLLAIPAAYALSRYRFPGRERPTPCWNSPSSSRRQRWGRSS